jgi:type IX secretion system substrate protein
MNSTEKNILTIDDLQFFPNHKTSQFTIGFNLDKKKDIKFNIYNLSGKKVFTTEFNDDIIEETINFAFYGSGTYFLQIEVEEKSLFKKIILN